MTRAHEPTANDSAYDLRAQEDGASGLRQPRALRTPALLIGMTGNLPMPDVPLRLFARHPSLIARSGETVRVSPGKGPVIAEGELALCVGRELQDASTDEAADAIAGYTLANDLTHLGLIDGPFTQHAKGLATPLGSHIAPIEAAHVVLTVTVNGETRATGSMSDLTLVGADLLAWISARMPLLPGDVVLCGSPSTAAIVTPGDVVEVSCDGLDTLTSHIVGPLARDETDANSA